MPKKIKTKTQIKKQSGCGESDSDRNKKEIPDNYLLKLVIGISNVKRWITFKEALSCKTNKCLATRLLDIAEEHLKGTNIGKIGFTKPFNENSSFHRNNIKDSNRQPNKRGSNKYSDVLCESDVDNRDKTIEDDESNKKSESELVKSDVIRDKTRNELEVPCTVSISTYSILEASLTKTNCVKRLCESVDKKGIEINDITVTENGESKKTSNRLLRNTPQADGKSEKVCSNEIEEITIKKDKQTNRIKLCPNCTSRHAVDQCPLNFPHFVVTDGRNILDCSKNENNCDSEKECATESDKEELGVDTDRKKWYARISLPDVLSLSDTNSDHGLGVFAKKDVQRYTQFGPIIGKSIKEVDIPEDFNMRDLWEINTKNGNVYITTVDLGTSNWMRYIRPAPSRDERNSTLINKDNNLYLVTIKLLEQGEELLYWQDSTLFVNKKKMEKTSCGGCNMVFAHPIYYRTHCSVFHDVRYSLTIRKYHCKICGEAVLGKENIMKHAAELHNGQGAYQCQFCKKFFLRLNYLEMHRTYGCSANPHRSRPLCDFCGRKFCQPQKLKVHIKRMHSDFAEVLKEFQCKNCLKILGSRAALQRHLKEVHQKLIDGACSCSRCGKHFQNKSNLKIHMLTHSGIKPFRCAEKNCTAGFTTKQCLQFHYRKVHSFSRDDMPKIQRSVDYTFQAYSGLGKNAENKRVRESCGTQTPAPPSTEESEIDDIDDESLDNKSVDDPPAFQSPLRVTDENSVTPIPSPLQTDTYSSNTGMKILSKGSKKWIADEPVQPLRINDIYRLDQNRTCKDDLTSDTLQTPESNGYERNKVNVLNDFVTHDASNASLLVEAALDSVCSEPNIDIDVNTNPNCSESLVTNLYSLSQSGTLPEVTYSEAVCMNSSRENNLISSPSVRDHISVTDELNDELPPSDNIGIDYSNFQQEGFSPPNSPEEDNRNSIVRNYIASLSPQHPSFNQSKEISPNSSPSRYEFGHNINHDHLSSDDSGMAAQNLSLHGAKDDLQLDLTIYKASYKLESQNYFRKNFKFKLESEQERKQINSFNTNDAVSKNYEENANSLEERIDNINQSDLSGGVKENEENNDRIKYPDDVTIEIRNKFDLDLELRLKSYENIDNENVRLRNNLYELPNDLDFRNKSFDIVDGIESRNKTYDVIDNDFRPDKTFEPLLMNSADLQGLDMSARSFHNYQNINRYHHLYSDVDRVDLRLSYSPPPPPPPTYSHADIMRVVSLDLTPPGRHSVDLSLRTHPFHQIASSRLLSEHAIQTNPHRLLDQSRLLSADITSTRHLPGESRLIPESATRILTDHTANRILSSNEQLTSNHLMSSEQSRLIADETRIISEQPRLLEQGRIIGDGRILPPASNDTASPISTFGGYSMSQSPYHPTPIAPRPHVSSPPTPYHHFSTYY